MKGLITFQHSKSDVVKSHITTLGISEPKSLIKAKYHGKSGFLTELNKINVLSNKGFSRIWCNAITSQNGNCQYTSKRKSVFTATLEANDVSKTAHISTVNLSHRLTGQVIVKNDVKVQPQIEDMLQPPTADEQHVNNVNIRQHIHSVIMPFTPVTDIRIRRKGLSTFQHSPMTKVKYLQTFTQIDEVPKEVKPYRFGKHQSQTITFDNNLLRKYRSALRARTGRETHLKDQKVIAKDRLNNYPSRALSKISRLALVGYVNKGAYSPLRAFFMRNIPMRSHIVMAKLWRDTFECAGFLYYLSTNLSQLCHPHLVVNGGASLKNKGVHTHA